MTAYWPQCDIFPHLRLPVYFLEACGHRIIFVVIQSDFPTSSSPSSSFQHLGAKCSATQGYEHSPYPPLTCLKFAFFPMHLELIFMEFWVRFRFYFFFYMNILSLQCSSPVVPSGPHIDTLQSSAPALIKALFSVAHTPCHLKWLRPCLIFQVCFGYFLGSSCSNFCNQHVKFLGTGYHNSKRNVTDLETCWRAAALFAGMAPPVGDWDASLCISAGNNFLQKHSECCFVCVSC